MEEKMEPRAASRARRGADVMSLTEQQKASALALAKLIVRIGSWSSPHFEHFTSLSSQMADEPLSTNALRDALYAFAEALLAKEEIGGADAMSLSDAQQEEIRKVPELTKEEREALESERWVWVNRSHADLPVLMCAPVWMWMKGFQALNQRNAQRLARQIIAERRRRDAAAHLAQQAGYVPPSKLKG